MIPRAYITEWRSVAPWQFNEQIEQDLLLSRMLVEIFSDAYLAERLAFRGGTALHKLYFEQAARYSEDIDLVQIKPEPIGETINHIRSAVSPWLGDPRRKQAHRNTTLTFRCSSEIPPVTTLRIKVEINCREHFAAQGIHRVPFDIQSSWFEGKCNLSTYPFEELLATKLRALYQRRRGRDLFDLWYALTSTSFKAESVIDTFLAYMANEGTRLTQTEFVHNIEAKLEQPDFLHDTDALLEPTISYDTKEAWEKVKKDLLFKLE